MRQTKLQTLELVRNGAENLAAHQCIIFIGFGGLTCRSTVWFLEKRAEELRRKEMWTQRVKRIASAVSEDRRLNVDTPQCKSLLCSLLFVLPRD